jgi:hypothetical protein
MSWLSFFDTSESFYFSICYFILASVNAAIFMVPAAAFNGIFVASQSLHLHIFMAAKAA